jgi:hypothetical protein
MTQDPPIHLQHPICTPFGKGAMDSMEVKAHTVPADAELMPIRQLTNHRSSSKSAP